jgi:dTDP-4-dehydrorhamnose reductase
MTTLATKLYKKVLIFGANGQLGGALWRTYIGRGAQVVALARAQCDVSDLAAVTAAVADHSPDVVINATAYNLVDRAEDEPDEAMRLNALVPAQLASASAQQGARFVHYSTDYVFGAGHVTPIDESRSPAPLSVYGRSKWLGERLVAQNCPDHVIIRCCGLYSERRHNFIRSMIRAALANKPLKVVSDQLVAPTWVDPLADISADVIDQPLRGTFHAVAHGQTSWFEYAAAIFRILELHAELTPVEQASWGAPAPRPAYSVLDNMMLRLTKLDRFEPWDVALARFLERHGAQIIAEEQAKLQQSASS